MRCPNCGTPYTDLFHESMDSGSCQNCGAKYMIIQITPPRPNHGKYAVYTIRSEDDMLEGFEPIVEKFDKILVMLSKERVEALRRFLNDKRIPFKSVKVDGYYSGCTLQFEIVRDFQKPGSESKEGPYILPNKADFEDFQRAIDRGEAIVYGTPNWLKSFKTFLKSQHVTVTSTGSLPDRKNASISQPHTIWTFTKE